MLHCLPLTGEEITNDVIEGPASVVFQQAGNRSMHRRRFWVATEVGPPSRGGPSFDNESLDQLS